ncbi:DNA metabolism protein [Deltaproteobacteria bacterium Smac51]|nr:DNA metabolism protein [Deltaproteobacteria bacterium Smac51]
MIVFAYDQTFEGLLSVIFEAFRLKIFPEALIGPDDNPPLLAERIINVETDEEKSERVWLGLEKKLSSYGIRHIINAWFTEKPANHELIIRYVKKIYSGISETNFADPDVLALKQLSFTVGREKEHVLQFVRFQKTIDGWFFAAIRPLFNVLPLVVHFFVDRFADQRFMIFDLNRAFGLYYDLETLHQTDQCPPVDYQTGRLQSDYLAEDETIYQEAWTKYFESIAITERANPRLQLSYMPKRFWPMLTEKQQQFSK